MSDVHTDEIKNALDKNKIQHSEAVMYRTVSNDFQPGESFDYDMLVFFSPAGVSSLQKTSLTLNRKTLNRYFRFYNGTSCTRCRTASRLGSPQRKSPFNDSGS